MRPVLNRVLGQAHLLAGRLDDARAALELAIAEANRVEHRYEEALALAALSELGDAPSEAAARRDALFEQLGIVALPAACDGLAVAAGGRPAPGLPPAHRRSASTPRSWGRTRPCRPS